MNNIDFTRNLTKGKIAETIFWMMFRENEKYILLPFGYEYTIPELTQYRKYLQNYKKIIDKISSAPDFIILSADKTHLYIVDIKFRTHLNERLKIDADKTLEKWEECYYFVVTPEGFFFDSCKNISENNGKIKPLSEEFVSIENQASYLAVLNEFIDIKKEKESIQPQIVTNNIDGERYWCPECEEYKLNSIGDICPDCASMLVEL